MTFADIVQVWRKNIKRTPILIVKKDNSIPGWGWGIRRVASNVCVISFVKISPGQFFFRKNKSIQIQLKLFWKYFQLLLLEGLDEGKHSCISFCDLSRAFDCVGHHTPINTFSIRGIPLEFFKFYLDKRTQCVSLKGNKSDMRKIIHASWICSLHYMLMIYTTIIFFQ